ncbi:MAG: DUF2007 domain-containing protein [gamma proteobacterium symbiont of Bathyaustriella thionipta]|nr:DUF2007 domain-containing protein [gamma proteobacterium symbiont of Bathyaustriella thionipta]
MRKIYQAADRIEARLLMDYLADHNIHTYLQGDFLAGAAGELPALQFPEIWVAHNADESRALDLIAEYQQKTPGEAWQCPQCGEPLEGSFEICWQCGYSRGSE